jgi:hypothetical protein
MCKTHDRTGEERGRTKRRDNNRNATTAAAAGKKKEKALTSCWQRIDHHWQSFGGRKQGATSY